MRIAFLSKGHGYGHAARDLRLITSMRRQFPGIEIEIGATGSANGFYRARGVECTDIGIPDGRHTSNAAAWQVWRYLHWARHPDLVVTDELTQALPFAVHALGVPAVLLTDWFHADFANPAMDELFNLARDVFYLDVRESGSTPARVTAPVHYTGPVTERFAGTREAARAALGLPGDVRVAVVSLGGMPNRSEIRRVLAPVVDAWRANAGPADRMLVCADALPDDPVADERIVWIGLLDDPTPAYLAADVAVVDAMGFTAFELIRNGIPVVALADPEITAAFGHSFARRVRFLEDHDLITTVAPGLASDAVWKCVEAAIGRGGSGAETHPEIWADVDDLAARIVGTV